MVSKKFISIIVVAIMLSLQGCAGVGLTMFGVGAGTAAGTGVNHTLSGIAYKTFTVPAERVHTATLETLAKMEMDITGDKKSENGRKITAKASDREISIELEPLTPRTTRMRVTVDEGVIFKDASTATEIIVQTANTVNQRV